MIHSIRFATLEDAAHLLDIYSYYVLNTGITFEYDVPTLAEFKDRIANISSTYPYIVAQDSQGTILGYAYASAFKGRAAYDWSVETTIYLENNLHKKGIGRSLYTALEDCLRKQNVINACACISDYTKDSEHFHEKLGYKKIAHFTKSGFKDTWLDMIWMEKFLSPHHTPPAKFLPISEIRSDITF